MAKTRKLHQLKGTIKHCWLGQVASKGSYQNQSFYYLEISSEGLFNSTREVLYVFANLVSPEVWTTLEQRTFTSRQYFFWCEKRVRGWRLIKWEIITN